MEEMEQLHGGEEQPLPVVEEVDREVNLCRWYRTMQYLWTSFDRLVDEELVEEVHMEQEHRVSPYLELSSTSFEQEPRVEQLDNPDDG
ncbi:hypothetical protein TELCIR_09543 [Teladorsagia circumcincta]|uniref:Uncharacterized protein n=1 Tax=Teladorsagia circumcincta TaxID=45464 RepID=A0A2G9UG01_TELCI|nr:hypothetical protein TELCIR_09543 [Teladorsagia circumcincta]